MPKYIVEKNGMKTVLSGDIEPKLLMAFARSGFSLTEVGDTEAESVTEEKKEIRKKEREA